MNTFANASKMSERGQTGKSFLGKSKLTPKKGVGEGENELRLSDLHKKSGNRSKSPIRRVEVGPVREVKKGSSRKV